VHRVADFDERHVAGAGKILVARHRAHLARTSFLAPRVHPDREIRAELASATGAVTLTGEQVGGYLIGQRREQPGGPHIWSYVAGQAVSDPAMVADLYAHAARRWVDDGLSSHHVFVPAIAELVEPWLRLDFGISAALAAQRLAPIDGFVTHTAIRPAHAGDTESLARLDRLLSVHLSESPSFNGITPMTITEATEDWRGFDADRRFTCFVAEESGQVIGFVNLYRRPHDNLRIPWRSIDLAGAVVEPECRGSGIGTALTRAAMDWAARRGFTVMTTDWRMSNLLAARMWPRRGFEEVFLRLHRSIP
jgi:aminoglycoside 6'-N-acetyltransferase I